MKNYMQQYLGNDYGKDHLRNFCLYWMKAYDGSGDEWRKGNDLDCICFDGDLRADTLMSAWTPVKWVADCLNKDTGMKFYKRAKDREYPDHYLKLLATDRDAYLPRKHRLTGLLDEFLELAELRCNFILLPVREMNCARYKSVINGEEVWLCDEVPATLSHIFDKDSLGRFFLGDDGEVDEEAVVSWVKREHLEMGFEDGCIARERVRPLIPGADPYEARWLTDEDEIYAALEYMIGFLAERQWVLSHGMTAEAV